jgi:hypothetical protein
MFIYEKDGKLNIVFQSTQNPVVTPDIVIGETVSGVEVNINGTGAEVNLNGTALANYTLPAATTAALGGVKKGVAVTDATDTTDVVAQLNALLAALRTTGAITQ